MHATFIASGENIRETRREIRGVRAIDVAPTIAFLMGIPGPQNAQGKILYDIVDFGGRGHHGHGKGKGPTEITILDISDYHGQLVPLSESADLPFGPFFTIGGSAFLKPWFDKYRKEARDGSITIAAGDSVGATPPISSFFGDTPTMEFMNRMGFSADGLGNHNFDKSEQYLRNTLIPLAKFPFMSANVVDAAGKTPKQWRPSRTFEFDNGVDLELIGFTNEDAPLLVFPNAFGPFQVTNATAAVNAAAAKASKAEAVVAFGHLGATAGTLTTPVGPLADLADGVTNVDAVIGDHTNLQVLTTRPNGVLVTENLSKGVRFTRVRLVVLGDGVIYKTADFHRPWNIGVTPDKRIQARIDELNAQIAPELNVVVGNSSRVHPALRPVRSRGRSPVRVADRQRRDGLAANGVPGGRAGDRLRDHELRRLAGRAHVPDDGQRVRLLPAVHGDAAPDHEGAGPDRAPVREHGRDGDDHRSAVEDDARERRLGDAGGQRALPAGLRAVLHLRHHGSRREPGDRRRPAGARTARAQGAPVTFGAGDTYRIATNDFMSFGGDGYPNLVAQLDTPSIMTMDERLITYLEANPAVNPTFQGRITCVGATCPAFTSP